MEYFLRRFALQGFSADHPVLPENPCLKIVRILQQHGKRCLPDTDPVKDVGRWKRGGVIRIGCVSC
jgi:hypothetical protein